MRIRSIKPEFFSDSKIISLPFETRLLFIGLWCLADRSGRLKDSPRDIKVALFPDQKVDSEACLTRLQAEGLIVRYEVDRKKYIEINQFRKHQYPHVKERASTIPAPCSHESSPSVTLSSVSLSPVSPSPLNYGETSTQVASPLNSDEAVLVFPTVGKVASWTLTRSQAAEWERLFPGVDVVDQCRKALAWAKANGLKTARGMPRYLVGWLGRANDSRKGRKLDAEDRKRRLIEEIQSNGSTDPWGRA